VFDREREKDYDIGILIRPERKPGKEREMELVKFFDHFVFKWCADTLRNAKTPDEIANFYVTKFVFGNATYLENAMAEYHLPNDFLKLHNRIITLAEAPYEEAQCQS